MAREVTCKRKWMEEESGREGKTKTIQTVEWVREKGITRKVRKREITELIED